MKKVIEFIPEFEIDGDNAAVATNIAEMVQRAMENPQHSDWEREKKKQRCIIIDIDGTLSDQRHRLHYVTGAKKDWGKFFGGLSKDKPNPWCVRLAQIYFQMGFVVYIVSGRPADYQEETEDWLAKYGIPYDFLYMRPKGDSRKDSIVKKEILETLLPKKSLIEFVVDDRQQVVDMWREEGLTCLQCNPYEQ